MKKGEVNAPLVSTPIDWREYFTYDAESGNLLRTANPQPIMAGRIAGVRTHRANGSPHAIAVVVCDTKVQAHRIIWEMHNGPIPIGFEIDHIDGDPWNNRLGNLRLATRQQNQWNRAVLPHNKSGYKGVHWDAEKKRFIAQISINGKKKHIGQFKTVEEAANAYAAEAKAQHGDFFRTTPDRLPAAWRAIQEENASLKLSLDEALGVLERIIGGGRIGGKFSPGEIHLRVEREDHDKVQALLSKHKK